MTTVPQQRRPEAYPVDAGSKAADVDDKKPPAKKPKGEKRSLPRTLLLTAIVWLVTFACILVASSATVSELPALVYETATLSRTPITAQDRPSAAVATLLMLYPLMLVDEMLTNLRVCTSAASQWFFLHAIGNIVVAGMSIPDFVAVAREPTGMLSVARCEKLPFPMCSDLPVCLIISMHAYHMLRFRLSADDLFHHLAFVPIIGGIRFVYPFGAGGNILPFFISGLPGAVDYILLTLVKEGRLAPLREKRLNCWINTWVRAPGIHLYLVLTFASWLKPLPGTPPEDLMPFYMLGPLILLCFFNAGHYCQRVVGNYYLSLLRASTPAEQRSLLAKVELHTC